MSSAEHPDQPRRMRRVLLLTIVIAALAAAAIAGLLVNIFERQQEARVPFFQVVELDDETTDPAVWGRNFPLQYDDYKRSVDMQRTRYGGSEALPHTPKEADPRVVVARSRLEEDPRLKRMWAGYAFSVDFREARGHAYMLIDQSYTERVRDFKQPGTCLNCHASVFAPYKQAGNGDLFAGWAKLNAMPYGEARKFVEHPVACIDCHDPANMRLRVTRPAFMEGIRALKASQGVADFEVNRDASALEMRAYVCGQCHVEYYFRGDEKRLVFPWAKGLKVEDMLEYYREIDFVDWTHAETGARMLKAQHPEFETWNQGIHARSGVTCADCHMPYKRVGGFKISDHHVRSPMLNVNRACQGCHHSTETELLDRVETIQTRFFDTRNIALDALMELLDEIKAAREAGVPDAELSESRRWHREGQFLLDLAESENSTGFHAPQETVRILSVALDYFRRGQVAAAKAGRSGRASVTVSGRPRAAD
jgi:nitrite reductase (cytochrome c-552)